MFIPLASRCPPTRYSNKPRPMSQASASHYSTWWAILLSQCSISYNGSAHPKDLSSARNNVSDDTESALVATLSNIFEKQCEFHVFLRLHLGYNAADSSTVNTLRKSLHTSESPYQNAVPPKRIFSELCKPRRRTVRTPYLCSIFSNAVRQLLCMIQTPLGTDMSPLEMLLAPQSACQNTQQIILSTVNGLALLNVLCPALRHTTLLPLTFLNQ